MPCYTNFKGFLCADLSTGHFACHFLLNPHSNSIEAVVISIIQMRKLRPRNAK